MSKSIFILSFTLLAHHVVVSQIFEESRYQLAINYKMGDKNTLSFQPEMRTQYFIQNTTITLWRLLLIRQWNDKVHTHFGFDWFNNWHNYQITGEEIRFHIETGFKDRYGKWTYFNRYRLDCRNFYDDTWTYIKTIWRFRYMINWSTTLYQNEAEQKLTLYLANEVFLNIAGSTHFNIYDQNRLGGYIVYKMNEHISIRSTYWWEYRKNNNYNHQCWIQLIYNIN